MRALPGALRRGLLFMFSPCCLKFPSAPPSSPGFSELYRLLYDKVPYRARFRSDKYAAVLRLQNTQPKDRRIYTAIQESLQSHTSHTGQGMPGWQKHKTGGTGDLICNFMFSIFDKILYFTCIFLKNPLKCM